MAAKTLWYQIEKWQHRFFKPPFEPN